MEPIREVSEETTKQGYWRKHIEAQKASRMTQVAYCSEHDLKLANFHYWKRKLEGRAPASSQLRFVPISEVNKDNATTGSGQSDGLIRVHAGEITLELPITMSTRHLLELVTGLRGP